MRVHRFPSEIVRFTLASALLIWPVAVRSPWAKADDAGSGPDGIVVSLIRLIATPARFDGSVVNVTGYLDERGTLFQTKDQAVLFDVASGIHFIDPTEDGYVTRKCTGSYVVLVATIRMRRDIPAHEDDPLYYVLENLRSVRTIDDGVTTACWPPKTSLQH